MALTQNNLVEAVFMVGHTSESLVESKFVPGPDGTTIFDDKGQSLLNSSRARPPSLITI